MNNQKSKNRFQKLQSIAVLMLLLFTTQTAIAQDVSASERQALIDLYNATDGANWTNNTNWNTSALVTNWYGVSVVDGKVTQLILQNNGLSGSIPSGFGVMTNLVELILDNNQLSGSIPPELGNLNNLNLLVLQNNELTGSIPSELGNLTSLVSGLWLQGNQLLGSIPPELGGLINLRALYLDHNLLTGGIPPLLGNLTNLNTLDLQNNQLTGNIPSELGDMTNLTTLWLGANQLSGTIPFELGSLSNLSRLQLFNNQLSGSIPPELGNLTNLTNLFLYNNQLSGSIPSELGNLINLTFLYLNDNNLSGNIPLELTNLTKLNQLYFNNNQLSGSIPDFTTISTLTQFRIDRNGFVYSDFEAESLLYSTNLTTYTNSPQAKVDLTESLAVAEGGSITLTSSVLISTNNTYQWYKDGVAIAGATSKDYVISNAIPTDAGVYHFLANNTIVTGLELERNPITLTISAPACGVSAAEKQALLDLYNATDGANWTNTLANNQPWDTNIPVCDWFGVTVVDGLTDRIYLDNNNLVGTLPNSIGDLINLEHLTLSNNQLSGIIPVEIGALTNLTALNLNKNQLSGLIPTQLGQLINLTYLGLETNQLTGNIPLELGQLINLGSLNLGKNTLTGEIPIELAQLSKLTGLWLDVNQLTGSIPTFLGGLLDLGVLSLSNNQLSGSIPTELGQLNKLVLLSLQNNQLTGNVPVELGQLVNLQVFSLFINQLTGTLPAELGQLANLRIVQFSTNKLSGNIPFSLNNSPSLSVLNFYDNEYTFSDFETEHVMFQNNLTNYVYSPQSKVDLTENLSVAEGISITLTSTALTSINNTYQWYKDGVAIAGATSKDYVISNALPADAGVYHFLANNSIVTGLELERNPITLTIGTPACGVSAAEKQALLDLYNATDGANWTNTLANNQPWDTNIPVCDWFGVTVVDGKVTQLKIDRNSLSGVLNSSIGDLVNLTFIELAHNQIGGNLPPSFGNLTNLERAFLEVNQFTGSIPSSFGNLSSLTQLKLGNNSLTGSIPPELGSLSNLNRLNLNQNDLGGTLPLELGNLNNLVFLYISDNNIGGNIPSELSNLTNLRYFWLGGNQLTGTIPIELGNLTNLIDFHVDRNQINGAIPIELGNLVNLDRIRLDNNQLTGPVPSQFGNFSVVKSIYLNNNQLSGDIPSGIVNLTGLNYFTFQNNAFLFNNFEAEHESYQTNIATYAYSPQAKVDLAEALSVVEGGSITLTSTALISANNSYQWYKDGVAILGATSKDYIISNALPTNAGVYHFLANNTIVTGLELERNPITLTVDASACGVSAAEKQALLDLYNATDGANWTNTLANNKPWDTNIPVCDWFGVTVVDGKVTELNLENNNLIGSIPSAIGQLDNLTILLLTSNKLSGNIPTELGQLTNLVRLRLDSNQLSGSIPLEIGQLLNMDYMILSSNQLTGSIPSSIGNLVNLTFLAINNCQLTGEIPATITNLTALEYLRFDTNELSGAIPNDIDKLQQLTVLLLGNNNLTNTIPPSLGNIPNLDLLRLESNQLSGSIPSTLGNLSKLRLLVLSNNQLSGNIPDSMGNMTNLYGLDLNNNQLSGTIPLTLGNLGAKMQFLNLFNNNLTGSIPDTFGNLTILRYLTLSNNNLSGNIPSSLKNITTLERIWMQSNAYIFNDLEPEFPQLQIKLNDFIYSPQAKVDLTENLSVAEGASITLTSTALTSTNNTYQWYKDGVAIVGATSKDYVISSALPADAGVYHFLANNSVVTGLELERNPITLTIGEPACGVSAADKQALLDFYNATDGANWTNNTNWNTAAPVCDWFGVFVIDGKINRLLLQDNNLIGNISGSIGNLTSLTVLDLSINNQLTGNIPTSFGNLINLQELYLQLNGLSGSIPAELGNLTNLQKLYLFNNNISGSIPAELGDLSNITHILLSNNQLTGSIPTSLGNLTNLATLSLFSNGLTGSIPGTLGNLSNLNALHLGANNLSGSIPSELGSLSSLTSLYLYSNQLTGSIPAELGNLANLVILQLYSNQFAGNIPSEISLLSQLNNFLIYENEFVFIDFESEHIAYDNNIDTYTFSPQAKVDLTEAVSVAEGNSITLTSVALTSANNTYLWFKDGAIISGATSKDYVISNAESADAGVYHFLAFNTIVTGLELERNPITLTIDTPVCGVSAVEKQALLDLYNATDGINWTNTLANNQPWDTNIPVCDWFGVTVVDGKVTDIVMQNNNLIGSIPNSIGDLLNLDRLALPNNQLSGNIPLEIGNLSFLVRLELNNNSLTGSIPITIGNLSSLELLYLYANNLSGTIPSQIGTLANLQTLHLAGNSLDGVIPNQLGDLLKLSYFNVGGNNLLGGIPATFANLTNLVHLHLWNNNFSGEIPDFIGGLLELQVFSIYQNNFTGALPASIGGLTKLNYIAIYDNKFSGLIPFNLTNQPNISTLNYRDNNFIFSNFESSFQEYQSSITSLVYIPQAKVDQIETVSVVEGGTITLTSNVLTSPNNNYLWFKDGSPIFGTNNKEYIISNASSDDEGVYHFLANNTIVSNLTLERNPITLTIGAPDPCAVPQIERDALIALYNATDGPNWTINTNWNTPAPVCDWYGVTVTNGHVTVLNSYDNNLVGTIPTEVGNLTNVINLYLHKNQLSGTIPSALGNLSNVQRLWLQENQLTGPIPVEFGNLSNLVSFQAGTNQLVGPLPSALGNLGNLEELSLGYNQINGTIPSELGNLLNLKYLNLFSNRLSGSIPPELGGLSSLTSLYLWGNQLTGSIPPQLGDLANLFTLYLFNNQLTGSIPIELANLNNVVTLRLDNNQLTGSIPPELGAMESLRGLYLSSNNLTGSIPIELEDVVNLGTLILNNNQLSGDIPSGFTNLTSLNYFSFQNNAFVFNDFETEHVTYTNNINTYLYIPQAKVDLLETVTVEEGNSITLTSNVLTSPNNTYQWYKDGVAIVGATSKDYVIANALTADAGIYHFLANNTIVTGLELERNPITLTVGPGDACGVSAVEKQALLDLFSATNGANWTNTLANNQPWDTNIPVCDWFGVTVVNGNVTRVIMPNNALTGTLTTTLENLVNLELLILNSNGLTGNVPVEITNIASLQVLYLYSNQLVGIIPIELGAMPSLRYLSLSNNQLTGPIPDELGNLSNLLHLSLSSNQLTNNVPVSLLNIGSLRDLRLHNNLLNSDIPNFTSIALGEFTIYGNGFVFSDFEAEHPSYINIADYTYSPQAKVDQEETISVVEGESITLTSTALTSTNNTYQWYKDGVAILGATNKDYVIASVSTSDAGVYHFLANNTIVTGLELERNTITLNIEPIIVDCIDILNVTVDGSFETTDASSDGRNGNLNGTTWIVDQGSPDSFLPPMSNTSDPYLLYNFSNSPNGGKCAGALRVGDSTESFYIDMTDLNVGETYVVDFYQSNATNLLSNRLQKEANGFWKVNFGNQEENSELMPSVTNMPVWKRARVEFTVTNAAQQLQFSAESSATDPSNAYPVYMLIDGIRVYKKQTSVVVGCYDIDTQSFCSSDDAPTIADLLSPISGNTSWYSQSVGGIQYNSTDELANLASTFVWADNGNSEPRVPVEVQFDLGAPEGFEYQEFDISEVPTLEDIEVIGNNIIWYSSESSTEPLPINTPLANASIYYAAQENNSCRLGVEVFVGILLPTANGFQEFCSSEDPTVADLIVELSNSSYSIVWYDQEIGGSTYNNTDALVNNTTYWAAQTNGSEFSEDRLPILVSIINVDEQIQLFEQNIAFAQGDTFATLTNFLQLDSTTLWYDSSNLDGTSHFNSDELIDGETYFTSIGEGLCSALEVLAITISIEEIEVPELISCIKFIPQPGDRYVISGWVREDALLPVSSEIRNFSEVSDAFIDLLEFLRDKVLANESLPPEYVLKYDPLAPDVDVLVPYIKNFSGRNVTVYNFENERENSEGVMRTVGFSFSLDPDNTYKFTYKTPQVRFSLPPFYNAILDYHYPMLNNPTIAITFKDVSVCGSNFCIESDFSISGETPYLNASLNNELSDGSSLAGMESSVEFFTYQPDPEYQVMDYLNSYIALTYKDIDGINIPQDASMAIFHPKGAVIDGWQRVSTDFTIPANAANMRITLKNEADGLNAYFDDVRMHPFNSNMKSFVYDPITQRLQAELDENNYATFYEYDTEGGLVRVKKETERGVYTIQETRSGNSKLNNN